MELGTELADEFTAGATIGTLMWQFCPLPKIITISGLVKLGERMTAFSAVANVIVTTLYKNINYCALADATLEMESKPPGTLRLGS